MFTIKNKFTRVLYLCILGLILSCGSHGERGILDVDLIPVSSGKEYQFIDIEGKIIINPQFSEASIFHEDLALVQTSGNEGSWGFISRDGKYKITPTYKRATIFSEGLAWVVAKSSSPTAINSDGEIQFALNQAEKVRVFVGGLAAFSQLDSTTEKWGFVNSKGEIKINPQFQNVKNFSGGMCAVENSEGKWGFINNEGNLEINYQFDLAGDFKNGYAIVKSDKKYGVIDEKGKFVINPQFESMSNDGNKFLIEQDGKFGWCNEKGIIEINPQFKRAYPFLGNKFAAVQLGDEFGYIDETGKIKINPQFSEALPFNNSIALVVSGKKIGFIDQDGKYVINPQFEGVSGDFVSYVLTGSSQYESVSTDYFDINAIVNRINLDEPEGLKVAGNLTISDIINKFGLDQNYFNEYSTEHLILDDIKLMNGVNFDFTVTANLTQRVISGFYYDNVFNPNAEILSMRYDINLSGKAYGKARDLVEAFEKRLSNYDKIADESSENYIVYKNAGRKLLFNIQDYQLTIYLLKNVEQELNSNGYMDSMAAADVYDAPAR